LKERGIDQETQEGTTTPPKADLPEIPEEPPSNTADVVRQIDQTLEKEGKDSETLPEPPEISARLFTPVKKKQKAVSKSSQSEDVGSPSTAKLLESVDKGLKRKNLETPEIPSVSTVRAAEPDGSQDQSEENSNGKVELTPRLAVEKNPLLLDGGEFEAIEEPEPGDKSEEGKKEEADQTGGETSAPLNKIPPAVLQEPSSGLPEEKLAETKDAAKELGAEEEEPGALDQVKEDIKNLGTILNPFSW
jgi:hypothetical protein